MSRKPRRSPTFIDSLFGWKGDYKASAPIKREKGGGHTHGWGGSAKQAQDRANCNAKRGKRY